MISELRSGGSLHRFLEHGKSVFVFVLSFVLSSVGGLEVLELLSIKINIYMGVSINSEEA